MATANSPGRNKNYGSSRNDSSNDHSPPRSSNSNYNKQTKNDSRGRSDSNESDDMTLAVVNDFKRFVQNKIRDHTPMSEPIVELEIANIRRKQNSKQCNFDQWKRDLPHDIENCPDSILRVSMAYGKDPREVKSIIQSKMNNINSNVIPTDTSLNNIIGPLKKLKTELDNSESPNLFDAVRNIKDDDIDRANRLLHSEAHHFAPGLKDYTFIDAQNAVEAIRETDCELKDSKTLLPIFKTFRDVDEIRQYLANESKGSTKRDESPPPSPDADRYPPTHSIVSNPSRNNNNQTSSFNYKPMPDPYASPSSSRSTIKPDNRSRDEPTRSPPNRHPERK